MSNAAWCGPMVGAALLLGVVAGVSQAAPPSADGDADGVPDERDACLYSPPRIVVGANGCSTPGDEDEDHVADVVDACPLSPAGARVDAQGCATDEDLDGVADGIDRCDGSKAGARVDPRGCAQGQVASAPPVRRDPPPRVNAPQVAAPPPAAAATIAATSPTPVTVARAPAASPSAEPERSFHFDPGESELGWADARALRRMARELAPEFERDAALALVVSGHGDIKFDGLSVSRVASARAAAVRDALAAAGIPAQRITVRVPGINEPRFHGDAQPRNCRVELRVTGRPAAAPPAAPPPATAVAAAIAPSTPATLAAPAARVFPDPPARVLPDPPPPRTPPASPVKSSVAPAPAPGITTPRALARVTVSFEPFSAVLDSPATRALNGFVQTATRLMLADTTSHVMIVSGIGPGEAGATAQRLAESRAGSVSAYLASLGLPHSRMAISDQAQTGERRTDVTVVSR